MPRLVNADAQVADGVIAVQLCYAALFVNVGDEQSARHRADVDGGIPPGARVHGDSLICGLLLWGLFYPEEDVEEGRVPFLRRLHRA